MHAGRNYQRGRLAVSKLLIRVKWRATIGGELREGVEEEGSWFMFDQSGGIYSHGPFKPLELCGQEYEEIIPLIKIKGNYMSVADIESLIDDFAEFSTPEPEGSGD